jgi:SET domain-containing protein
MVFYALNDIKPEEQLFINYKADTEVNTDLYKDKNLF